MKIFRKTWSWLIPAGVALTFGCAKQGAPTGGPQDLDPPKVLRASPDNYSTNFEGKKISITFDEYLDMANFTQELVVSPPMEEKPLIKLKNKTLIIEFEEELKEEVTYTFNFGEGISDLNEKNVLLNYEYVFSTGEHLDSLSVKGTLKKAFDLDIPDIPVFVMLYNELNDSIPLTDIPWYVGRTDKQGNFAVNNLKAGTYKLFVLKDGNNNFLFDLPSEQIAFLDSSIIVDPIYFKKLLLQSGAYDSSDLLIDTSALAIDTTGMSPDSIVLVLDSLKKETPDFNSIFVDLFMFQEDPVNQFVSDNSRKIPGRLEMVFNLPLSDSFSYRPIFPADLKYENLLPEINSRRDTVKLWLADTVFAKMDTVKLAVQYTMLDTLFNPIVKEDTIQFTFRETTTKKKNTKDKTKTPKAPSVKLTHIKNNGKVHPLKPLTFISEFPVKSIDPSKFELYIIPDSVEIKEAINPYIDSGQFKKVRIVKTWKEEGAYRIVLYPGAINDIYGATNDTLDLKFKVKPLSEYGKINLNLENVKDTILIEIYKKDTRILSREAVSDGLYVFDFILPDTYQIKFLHDNNRNGKWDTGRYLDGLQPEKVEFLPGELKVRANWDHDVTYVIGSNTSAPKTAAKTEENKQPLFK